MTNVRDWLAQLGLGEFADAFEAERIELEHVPKLSDADLKELGLPMGPRRAVLDAAGQLEDQLAQTGAPGPAAPREAERRQLTVMFCDLVGSTELSGKLDPEELREVMRAYQAAAGDVIGRYEGHVAQYLGDGLMTYFGWPLAHEDDAHRAVRASLEIVDSIKALDTAVPLSVRIGIATGPVVVGETGGGDASVAETAVGETPNLAARVQGLAAPDQVLISETTRKLVAGTFDLDDLGAQGLKGVVGAVHVFRVLKDARVDNRFDAATIGGLTPFVGRDTEIAMLLDRWQQAKDGEGQVVLLSGEPGIGKSRIMQVLRQRVSDEPHIRLRYQCSPFHANSAFYPIIAQLAHAAGFRTEDTPAEKLEKLETVLAQSDAKISEALPLIAGLMSLPLDRFPTLDLSPLKLKQKTIESLILQTKGLAARRPLLMLFEDAHWIDPTTLDAFSTLIESLSSDRILLVITYRPSFDPPWTGRSHVTVHSLNRLSGRQGADMIMRVTGGKPVPAPVTDLIVAKTDGVPLFVEELTKTVLELGQLRETDDGYELDGPLPALAIPATLRDLLTARLDRLAEVKEIAQVGACIGREFSFELLEAVAPMSGDSLAAALDVLAANELIFGRGTPPDATYKFKHALVQDAAYESLLKTSRQQYHARIADVLAERFPDTAEDQPELLAHHYTEAGMLGPAVAHWHKAGQRAMRRPAPVEAERHLRRGLSLVADMPDGSERNRLEIALNNTLGVCLMPMRGFGDPEIAQVFSKAAEISEREDEGRGLFVALRGKGQYQMISGDLPTAREQAGHILTLAEQLDDIGITIEAHHLGWSALSFTGDLAAARKHAETGIELYQADRDHHLTHIYSGHDPGVCCRSFGSLALWQLGEVDKALALNQDGEALAGRLSHPFTITIAYWAKGIMAMLRRDAAALHEAGELIEAHCVDKGIPPFIPLGRVYRGGAMIAAGDAAGIDEMRAGVDGVHASGTEYTVPIFYAWLADCCATTGQVEAGLAALTDGLAMSEKNSDRFMLAEFHRIRGELLLRDAPANADEAEASFRQAIDVAHGYQAKSLELRAATSLARHLQQAKRAPEAVELLTPLYDGFTEGLDTPDLVSAKSILGDLA